MEQKDTTALITQLSPLLVPVCFESCERAKWTWSREEKEEYERRARWRPGWGVAPAAPLTCNHTFPTIARYVGLTLVCYPPLRVYVSSYTDENPRVPSTTGDVRPSLPHTEPGRTTRRHRLRAALLPAGALAQPCPWTASTGCATSGDLPTTGTSTAREVVFRWRP